MKTNLIAAAVAALAAVSAGSALAQSSVTIYGRLNLSAEQQDYNGRKLKVLQNSSSRLGFRGVEDLGGGLRAGFTLEHGFSPDTGLPNATFWGRQSEVNLGGGFGMVRLGNFTSEAYYATADYVSMHNHDTGTSADALYAYVGRNNNKIAYRLPEFVKGMSLEAAVSAAEGVPGRTRSYDAAWNYSVGKLQLGAGYEKNNNARQFAGRALYDFGMVVLGGYVQRDTDGYGAGLGTRNNYRLAAAFNFGVNELHVNVGRAGNYSNRANSSAKQYTLGYNYNLSKRTKVYAFLTKLDDSAANLYGGANYGIATTGRNTDFRSLALGVRHNF